MQRRILVYGHGDKDSLQTAEDIQEYIAKDIFAEDYNRRYRYTQRKEAHVIVLSWEGKAYGHFEVQAMEEPTAEDREEYPRVRQVYIIRESARYGNPVPLSALGITRIQFGKCISEEQFSEIETLAGTVTKYSQ
jgi:hypothetical protein